MPEEGELLWCKHCREYMEATIIDEFRVRCQNCRFSRRYGTAELTALTKATHHALTKMHEVVVTRGQEIVEKISPGGIQQVLPSDTPENFSDDTPEKSCGAPF